MENKLYILVGISGSGKSTIAKEMLGDTAVIVSTDKIREEVNGSEADQSNAELVFELFHSRIRGALEEGKDVIADATHIGPRARAGTLQAAAGLSCKKIALVVDTPLEQCLRQNQIRDRHVPEEVIRRQAEHFVKPSPAEGFDEIIDLR